MKILVIGDYIQDIIVVPESEIRVNTDTKASISQTGGGSAANVAAWAAHSGADVTFTGCVNSNDVEKVTAELNKYSVKTSLKTSDKVTGSLVVLVDGENRSMLTDRGANQDLKLAEFSSADIKEFQIIFISGYAMLNSTSEEVKQFISRAKQNSKVFVDPGSTGFIKDYGVKNFIQATSEADVLIPNEEEHSLLGNITKITLVTKGSHGVDYFDDSNALVQSWEAQNVLAIDPTGAGDAFAGGLVAEYSKTGDIVEAVPAGIACAGLAVQTIGARPQL